MLIARVAVAHPLVIETLDYLVPGDLSSSLAEGMRVMVPFGNQVITGYVVSLSEAESQRQGLKYIDSLIEDYALIKPEILSLATWISHYYFNSLGDVLKSALPPGISVEQKSILSITETGCQFLSDFDAEILHREEETSLFELISALEKRKGLTVKELRDNHSTREISRALHHGYLREDSNIDEKNLELKRKAIQATPLGRDSLVEELSQAPKQQQLLALLQGADEPVLLTELSNKHGISSSIAKGLAERGYAEISSVTIRRDPFAELDSSHIRPHDLTDQQYAVFEPLLKSLSNNSYETFLLHGVTGSGKTEVYLHLIQEAIEKGGTALVLIPEISLTPQFAQRFYHVFGDTLAILHSGLSQGQRLDEWFRIYQGEVSVVLGTRLSVLAPLDSIKLVIVDEEHDQSYKQDERMIFHARDVAVKRAADSGATCILGSATPSVESMANVRREKYTLLELHQRIFDRPLPEIQLVDLRTANKRNEEQLLPDQVEDQLATVIEREEQAIVLVGRKGHTPFIICRACGYSFECRDCSISMSWHEKIQKMKCHYCGRMESIPGFCPSCKSPAIGQFGMGTAKVEDYLKSRFPNVAIDRMDRDAISRPADYQRILSRFASGETSILVGTQMLAKGHDYPNVTAVVTLGIDSILRLPDFRHSERVFQLLTQVSGRAGRGEKAGLVSICTYKPGHFAIQTAAELDYQTFYEKEFEYRQSLSYPPFGYLTLFLVEHYRKETAMTIAASLAEKLHSSLSGKGHILGPALAPYARLRNRWRYQVILKSRDRVESKEEILRIRAGLKHPTAVKIIVDPVSVM